MNAHAETPNSMNLCVYLQDDVVHLILEFLETSRRMCMLLMNICVNPTADDDVIDGPASQQSCDANNKKQLTNCKCKVEVKPSIKAILYVPFFGIM